MSSRFTEWISCSSSWGQMTCSRIKRAGIDGSILRIRRLLLDSLMISLFVLGFAWTSLADSDEEILLEFKRGVTSDPNNTLGTWQNSSSRSLPFCRWNGVTCDNYSRVVTISLSSHQLSGRVSPQIGGLTYLRDLDLSNNSFSGFIPTELGNCSNLVNISLNHNGLSGSIPESFGNLRRISILDLSFNIISESIPPTLGNCSNLLQILLNSNRLIGSIPSSLWDLRALQRLLLSENILSSLPPPSGGSFHNLSYLDISSNNLSGRVLPLFSNATALLSLGLSNNRLAGSIPPFDNLRNLIGLSLSSNFLTGIFPSGFFNLTRLVEVKIADNELSGGLPRQVGNLSSLAQLDLSENKLTGEIPSALGSLRKLLILDLHGNTFLGAIPSSFGALTTSFAIRLNLARNNLSGPIPITLGKLAFTQTINLSSNHLDGPLPNLDGTSGLQTLDLSDNSLSGNVPVDLDQLLNRLTYFNVARNQLAGTIGLVITNQKTIILTPGNDRLCLTTSENLCLGLGPGFGSPTRPRTRRMLRVLLSCLAGVSILVLTTYWVCFQYYYRVLYLSDAVSGYCRGHQPVRLTVQDLITATKGYDESQMIGHGGTSTVYKGLLPVYPFVIAVKKFQDGDCGRGKLLREAQIMRCIRHCNIVEAWGMTSIPRRVNVLVLEYVDNGTLNRHLHPPNSGGGQEIQKCELNWDVRLQIATDVAAAVRYLHNDIAQGMAVIHGDLKPGNIFLDANLTAKVGDFGLAKLLITKAGERRLQRHWEGTFGYSPPEHAQGVISTAGDVYSFGVVILELVTRRRPAQYTLFEAFGGSFIAWARAGFSEDLKATLDPALVEDYVAHENEIALLFRVGLLCTRDNPHERPTMEETVEMIHSIHRQKSSPGSSHGSQQENSVPTIEELIYEPSFTSIGMATKKDWTSKFYAFDCEESNASPKGKVYFPDVDSWFSLFQLDMRDSNLLRAVGFDSYAIGNIREQTRRRAKTRRFDARGKSWMSRLWGTLRNRRARIKEEEEESSTRSSLEETTERASKRILKQIDPNLLGPDLL